MYNVHAILIQISSEMFNYLQSYTQCNLCENRNKIIWYYDSILQKRLFDMRITLTCTLTCDQGLKACNLLYIETIFVYMFF